MHSTRKGIKLLRWRNIWHFLPRCPESRMLWNIYKRKLYSQFLFFSNACMECPNKVPLWIFVLIPLAGRSNWAKHLWPFYKDFGIGCPFLIQPWIPGFYRERNIGKRNHFDAVQLWSAPKSAQVGHSLFSLLIQNRPSWEKSLEQVLKFLSWTLSYRPVTVRAQTDPYSTQENDFLPQDHNGLASGCRLAEVLPLHLGDCSLSQDFTSKQNHMGNVNHHVVPNTRCFQERKWKIILQSPVLIVLKAKGNDEAKFLVLNKF